MTGAEAPARKIKLYDFRRPDKFSKDQTRVLQMLHESYARLTSTLLMAHLRMEVRVSVEAVDQMTYEEFLSAVPSPTVLARIDMDPLKGEAVLQVEPSVTYGMLDRLFGGEGVDIGIRREITPIESLVLEELIRRSLGNLREAWSFVVDLQPRLGGIESNPRFAQIVPPQEMVVLITLKVAFRKVEGMVKLCFPYLTIQDVVPRLSQRLYYTAIRGSATRQAPPVADLGVDLDVHYEGEHLSLAALRRLGRGSRVAIPGWAEGDALLRAGGAPLCNLKAGPRRRRGARTYALAEGGRGAGLLSAATPSSAGPRPDAMEPFLRTLTKDVVDGVKALEGRIEELTRRQAELQDQLLFQPSEHEGGPSAAAGPKRAFSFLTTAHCDQLSAFLTGEHPQLVALMLSRLEATLAACLLEKMPSEAQPDIVRRMVSMGPVMPEILGAAEGMVQKQMSMLSSEEYAVMGGADMAAQVLGVAPRSLERRVVEALQESDPALAEEIKKRMFVFEDIVLLEDAHAATVLREVSDEDLVLSLKATEDVVVAKILKCLGERTAGVKAALARTGAVRLVDADAAQQRVVVVVRRMEEEGRIAIPRAGQEVVG